MLEQDNLQEADGKEEIKSTENQLAEPIEEQKKKHHNP
jgi:hypothetical protein